jgi:predicted aspartyl protease
MEEETNTTSTGSILDNVLVLDITSEEVNLDDFDIVLTDMHRDVIQTLEIDGVKHLSLADITSFPPLDTETTMKGITFGEHQRVLVRAVLSSRRKFVNAIMLVDTASPWTFLTEDTFKMLGINNLQEQSIDSAWIVINGRTLCTRESKGHFKDVDVLGTDFLSAVELCVNYPNKTARLTLPAI